MGFQINLHGEAEKMFSTFCPPNNFRPFKNSKRSQKEVIKNLFKVSQKKFKLR